jgi:hypothetical protein
MARTLRLSDFVPRGFRVESAVDDGARIVVTLHPTSETSSCPDCGTIAARIHSRYIGVWLISHWRAGKFGLSSSHGVFVAAARLVAA